MTSPLLGPRTPGESYGISLTIQGTNRGSKALTSSMLSDLVAGSTVVTTPITVTARQTHLSLSHLA